MAREYLAKPDASTHVVVAGKVGADGKMAVTSINAAAASSDDDKMPGDKMGEEKQQDDRK